MSWAIEYWCNDKKKSPIEDWFDRLTDGQLKSVAKELKLLELCGNELKLPHSRSLGNRLFELRERRFGYCERRKDMKTKSFEKYLEKRLKRSEIVEIKAQAVLEKQVLSTLRQDINGAINSYMRKEKIGFNELVRRLNISPTQMAKIRKGEANLTLATIAHIFALLKRCPHLVFE